MNSPAPQPAGSTSLVRAIGRWTLAGLVLNSIIGSGIFGLPSDVARLLGWWSPLAYLVAAAGMGVLMACFAEVASRFDRAGGPYLYAREAYGLFVGIQMGWLAWLVRLTAAAANSNLFANYLAEFWPGARGVVARTMILAVFIGVLAAINVRGVKSGARVSSIFVFAKLLPLLLFIVAGLVFLGTRTETLPAVTEVPVAPGGAWLQAILVLVFAFGGFEAALIPMAEARNPRRDVAFALFSALAVCTLVYTLIQIVVVGVLAAAPGDRPLATAARHMLGTGGAALMTLAALLSVYGYMGAAMLSAPRLTYAFAEEGVFPRWFAAVHRRFRTPYVSILTFALLVFALAAYADFRWNVTLSAVSRLFTYALVCGALIVLRRRNATTPGFRLPGGPWFAAAGVGFTAVLVTRMGATELYVILATLIIALLNWAWVKGAAHPG